MSKLREYFYELQIGGLQFVEELRKDITNIGLNYVDNGASSLNIDLTDEGLYYLNLPYIKEETAVYFRGGWKDAPIEFNGYVSFIDIQGAERGDMTLTLNCLDESFAMSKDKHERTWENTNSSSIAKNIFESYGFTTVIDSTGDFEESKSQSNNDMAYLVSLAKDQHPTYITYVKDGVGYFIKQNKLKTPKLKLEYNTGWGNLLTFNCRINKTTYRKEVSNSDIDSKTGNTTTSTSTSKATQGTDIVKG